MKKILMALTVSSLATSAMAMDPMPKDAGFSGFVGIGAIGGQVKSNFNANIVGIDLSDDLIYKLDSPDDTNVILPSIKFNVGYTFANEKTRVSVRNLVETGTIDFSSNSALAVRHDFDSAGNLELAALGAGLINVKVYENPYLTNQKRKDTEKSSTGGRFAWDKIFGSELELIASIRKIEVDRERSGQDLGLSTSEQKLLDREGDVTRVELGYTFKLGGGEHMLRPSAAYINRNLDGDAMAQDGYELGVNYVYDAGDFTWLNAVVYQNLNGDKVNPIFNKVNDANVYVLATEVRFPEPFGWEKWTVAGGVQWGDNDADIDFNQSSALMASGTIFRAF